MVFSDLQTNPQYAKCSNVVGYLHFGAALLLTASLLFRFKYQYWPIVLFFSTYVIDYIMSARWKKFRWTHSKWIYVAFILFYLLIPIWQLFDATLPTPHYRSILENRLSFLAFGIIGILGISEKWRLRYFGYSMIATAAITSLWLIFFKIGFSDFITSTTPTILFQEARIEYVNSHMAYNLYLNTALIFAFYIIRETRKRIISKTFVWIGSAIILYILLLSEGRTGFITAIFILCTFLMYCIWKWRKRYFAFAVFASIVFMLILIPRNPRLTTSKIEHDPRSDIWNVCLEMIDERPVLGYGVSSARNEFVDRLIADSACYNGYYAPFILNNPLIKTKYQMHPHNAFIEAEMEFGILGISLLIFMLLYPMVMFPAKRRIYVILYTCSFGLQGMFETIGGDLLPLSFCFFVVLWHLGSFFPNKQGEIEELE